MSCEELIYDENSIDFLENAAVTGENYRESCRQQVGPLYNALYVKSRDGYGDVISFGYYNIPKLYGLLDTGAIEKSGIYQVREQPGLRLNGKGILIGLIDTGIDYTGDIFRRPDGTTRIVSIWDQTIPGYESGRLPEAFAYGSEFTEEELNQAIQMENPYELVGTRDEIGHGTYLASVAAGNELRDQTFSGAAPDAELAVVKLKSAKQNLREYYQIQEEAYAYQETDIMAGVSYLVKLAEKRRQPIVICIALGTNSGAHSGGLPLARTLDVLGSELGVVIATGTGNETTRAHHYMGVLTGQNDYEDVEIRVEEGEKGFVLELWGKSPETFSVAIRSPEGEVIPRIFVRQSRSERLGFVISKSRIEVSYRLSVVGTGEFLAFMRFIDITPGIWTVRVYNDLFISGQYHMWLPVENFIRPSTGFLRPSGQMTLTSPSDAFNVISVASYQYRSDSIYVYSGRGYTLDERIRPDLAAPGVDIDGYIEDRAGSPGKMRLVTRSGSSAAAAMMSGAAALLAQWALQNGRYLNSADARAYFIRGAERNPFLVYPNREWGFGSLDVYGVFRNIQTQVF